ncbi:MAG: hypothetical protein KY468_15590 [Armatimonadetes bacterium]|nr:hypothetical protein [Armatimonadota bacterium]
MSDLEVLIPLTIFSIPIVAIVTNTIKNMYQMKLDRERGADKSTVNQLNQRVAELENRVMTLQDIIISGDYEVRRRLEQAARNEQAAAQPGAMTPPAPSHTVPHTHPSATQSVGG